MLSNLPSALQIDHLRQAIPSNAQGPSVIDDWYANALQDRLNITESKLPEPAVELLRDKDSKPGKTLGSRYQDLAQLQAQADAIRTDAEAALQETQKPNRNITEHPQAKDFWGAATEAKISELRKLAASTIGRNDIQDMTLYRILNLKASSGLPMVDLLKKFGALDEAGTRLRKGIHDPIVVNLLDVQLKHPDLTAEAIVERFTEIDQLGSSTKPKFSVEDPEVSILTALSFDKNLPAKELTDRFFDFEKRGREISKDFHVSDQALALLTKISFEHNISSEALLQKFTDFYHADKEAHGRSINDLALTLEVEHSLSDPQFTAQKVVGLAADFKAEFSKQAVPMLGEEDLSRWMVYAENTKQSPVDLAAIVGEIRKVRMKEGRSIDDTQSLMTVAYLENALKADGKDFAAPRLLPFLRMPEMKDLLIDEETVKLIRKARKDARGSTHSSSGSGTDSSSATSNFGQLGFAIGPNGVDIDLNLGGGLALDLETGGLATGGPIGVDLTGSNSIIASSWSAPPDTTSYSAPTDYGSGPSPF